MFEYNDESFTSKLKVERTKGYPEGLEDWEGKSDIHVEVLFTYASELHVNPIIVEFVYQLEVLHGSLVHATVEV